MRAVRWSFVSAVATLLVACGGGGESSAPSTSQDGIPTAPGLQFSRQNVSISAEQGDAISVETVDGTVNGATAPVYVYVRYTNQGLMDVGVNPTAGGGRLYITGKDAATLSPGAYRDSVVVDVCYDSNCSRPVLGSPKTIAVTYEVKPVSIKPAILLSTNAVAFAKVPFGQRLTQQVTVLESGSSPGRWAASSNVSWLRVTSSGASGDKLQIEALPAGLPSGVSQALVTVQSDTPGARPAVIRVGLYVSSTSSADKFSQALGSNVLVDPSRPYVYSKTNSALQIDHVYTGQRVNTVSLPGVQFGNMDISSDGAWLVVVDTTNASIRVFDTDRQVFTASYALSSSDGVSRLEPLILKANGRDIVVVQGYGSGQGGYLTLDLATGAVVSPGFTPIQQGLPGDWLKRAQDGRHFVLITSWSPNWIRWAQLTENSHGRLTVIDNAGGSVINAYVHSDYVVSESGRDVISCEGTFSAPAGFNSGFDAWVYADYSLTDSVSWSPPEPTSYGQSTTHPLKCRGIEAYEGSQLFLSDLDNTEFQVREGDGRLVSRWANTKGLISGLDLKLSSDYLRAFDGTSMQDLPR